MRLVDFGLRGCCGDVGLNLVSLKNGCVLALGRIEKYDFRASTVDTEVRRSGNFFFPWENMPTPPL